MQKTDLFPLHSHDDSSPLVPSTTSEPAHNRPPTQDGKQTSQESVNTSNKPRANQAPVKHVDCCGGSQA